MDIRSKSISSESSESESESTELEFIESVSLEISLAPVNNDSFIELAVAVMAC